jgi:antitoxin (DNA-binding transcriptional repressor) of toxin-antitoxin stability system
VDRAAAGEEIIIAKAGKPLARLTAFSRDRKVRVPGGWEGQVQIAPDFDEPLPVELLDAFEGRGGTDRLGLEEISDEQTEARE